MLAMVMFPRYFVWKFVRPFHYPNFLGFFCSIPFLPRAKKMHLVGYNTKNMTYRLWDPERPHEITNSAEVSFRDKSARDVGRLKAGYNPFPDPGTFFVPGVETEEIQKQESAEKPMAPQVQMTLLPKDNRQRSVSPDSVSAQQWSLTSNVKKIAHASY